MYFNHVEPIANIVVEPDMEPVIVYHTDDPVITGSGKGDNDNQPAIDENNNIEEVDDDNGIHHLPPAIDENSNIEEVDDDNGIHHLPDEFYNAQTEQMENPSYGIDVPTTSTRAGRISRPPPRLIKTATMAQEMNNKTADYNVR
jgi:hypothetical protein